MFTTKFWKSALERAVKTFAQAALALLTGDGLGIVDVDWGNVVSVAALATLASLLTSIVSLPVGEPHSPSIVDEG
ncbi:holin [Actinoplanes sp. NPDC048796]|uniref:holin n=1 Tax=Actinoplanes sp. NPDC048796 TaxID=3155640 RepID=UPI0033D38AA9